MPEHRHAFLREKGRYFLYPRNYGQNDSLEDYILVFGVPDFVVPRGYYRAKTFAADKFLLKKKDLL
jgi:hypothetical protein